MQIPKIIHQVWVGPNKPPGFLGRWKDKNPDFDWWLWDIKAVKNFLPLYNQHLFDDYANSNFFGNISGLVDILRYEILYKYGGIYIDADIDCLRPLEGSFLESDFFVSYVLDQIENTLSCAVIGCTEKHPVIEKMINELNEYDRVEDYPHRFSGSIKLTEVINKSNTEITKLPTYYFHPTHYSGAQYQGEFKPFGDHKWFTASKLFNPNEIF